MNKIIKYLIIAVLCIVIFVFAFIISNPQKTNRFSNEYNPTIPTNAVFINYKDSTNFNCNYKVIIEPENTKDEHFIVNFIINIEPKNDHVYKKIYATAFIDDNIINKMDFVGAKIFGNEKNSNINFNKECGGLSISKGLTTSTTDMDLLKSAIKKGIKLKISWQKGVEYLLIHDVEIVEKNN